MDVRVLGVLMLAWVLVVTPVSGQLECSSDDARCAEPTIEVDLADEIELGVENVQTGHTGFTELRVPIKIRYDAPTTSESTLSMEWATPAGLPLSGFRYNTVGGQLEGNVLISAEPLLAPGRYQVPYWVNSTATETVRPGSHPGTVAITMPWVVYGRGELWSMAPIGSMGRYDVEVWAQAQSNAPVDLVAEIRADPELRQAASRASVVWDDQGLWESLDLITRIRVPISQEFEPGTRVHQNHTISLRGASEPYHYATYFVANDGGQDVCLDGNGGQPQPQSGDGPICPWEVLSQAETEQESGYPPGLGFMKGNWWELLWMGLLVLMMLGTIAFGILLMVRGDGKPASRYLGTFLIAYGTGFGIFAFHNLLYVAGLPRDALVGMFATPLAAVFVVSLFLLGPLLLGFALHYPVRYRDREIRVVLLSASWVATVLVMGFPALVVFFSPNSFLFSTAGMMFALPTFVIHVGASIVIMNDNSKQQKLPTVRARLTSITAVLFGSIVYASSAMLGIFVIPVDFRLPTWMFLSVVALLVGPLAVYTWCWPILRKRPHLREHPWIRFVVDPNEPTPGVMWLIVTPVFLQVCIFFLHVEWMAWLAPIIIVSIFLVPPAVIGYSVARYQVAGLDRTLRFTVNRTLVGLLVVVVFFAVTEAAELFLQEQFSSAALGLMGAGMLALAFKPLERMIGRFTHPISPDDPKMRRKRSQDLYRALYEQMTGDGAMTTKEERTLGRFAASLGLGPEDTTRIREQADVRRHVDSE